MVEPLLRTALREVLLWERGVSSGTIELAFFEPGLPELERPLRTAVQSALEVARMGFVLVQRSSGSAVVFEQLLHDAPCDESWSDVTLTTARVSLEVGDGDRPRLGIIERVGDAILLRDAWRRNPQGVKALLELACDGDAEGEGLFGARCNLGFRGSLALTVLVWVPMTLGAADEPRQESAQ